MRRRDIVLLLVAALAIRAVYLAQLWGYDLADVLILDPRAYDAEAQRILAGGAFPHPFYQAPLYSYFLAAVYSIVGRSFLIVRVLQLLLGAAAVVLTAQLGARIFGRAAGIIAGVLALLYGVFPYYEGQIMKTSLTLFLCVVMLYLLDPLRGALARDRTAAAGDGGAGIGLWRCAAAGLVLGLAVLTRENLLLFLPVAVAAIGFALRHQGGVRAAAAFGIAAVVAIFPVTLHNFRAGGEWILVTSQGGQNFYIGNHRDATGTYTNPSFVRPDPLFERPDFHAEAQRRTGAALSAGEASSYWYAQAVREMAAAPARALGLLGKKLLIVFEGVERPDNESYYVLRDEAPILRVLALSMGPLATLGFLGMVLERARARELIVLHLFVLANVAALVLFFVVSRYRVVLAPVLMVFAAQALVRAAGWWRARRLRPLAAASLFVATCTAVLGIPDLAGPDPRDYRSLNHFLNRGRMYSAAGRVQEAAESYREAIAQNDQLAFLHFEYADVLWRLGRLPEVRNELEAALRIRPEFPSAHNNLGIVLAEQGDLAAAERAFLEASRLLPNWPDPLENLLRVYEAAGDADRRESTAARLRVIGRSGSQS